jgi:lipopolysaccharide transport system ATP-binding protein
MAAVIKAENLGKKYRRGAQISRGMLRETIARVARSPLTALRRAAPTDSANPTKKYLTGDEAVSASRPASSGRHETFWALQDVSLEVQEGEVLGLIGRNGAGKTTLLKILSRITRPTTGWAEIHGRVRSLLEVGTGFHGELTGRENMYLSGSILGMSKREIDRKLDDIVAFAEIEKFIDTPVKHYSSGMYVRLAFAVAAHLEPEILLVDEVLAVGDINFQKKCLGKMGDVARQGRTVVLVSHQMNQMRRLCHRVVWVDGGQIRMTGSAHEVVSAYESAMARGDYQSQHRTPGTKGRFTRWELTEPQGEGLHVLNNVGPVTVKFAVGIQERLTNAHHGIALYNHDRQLIWGHGVFGLELEPGEHEFSYSFPMLPLRPGAYSWLVSLFDQSTELVDSWDCTPEMVVAASPLGHPLDEWAGLLNIPSELAVLSKAAHSG